MNGRIPEQAAALLSVASRSPAGRGALALCIAVTTGVTALIAPPVAFLILALLGARALMRAETSRIDLAQIAGPLLASIAVGACVGLPGAIGVVFVWRMFADTQWSVREAAQLAMNAGRPAETTRLSLVHAWLTPLYGLTVVAFTSPHLIAGLPLDLPHVPAFVPWIAGVVAIGAVFDWALRRAADWRLGELAGAPAAHLLTHHALFLLAFGLTLDVSAGVVTMLAWRLMHAAPLRAPQASLTAVP